MPEPTTPSPFALNPARITILVLGVLALVLIVGGIMGGVSNYQALKEASEAPATGASSAQ